jgi:hypothetical protein
VMSGWLKRRTVDRNAATNGHHSQRVNKCGRSSAAAFAQKRRHMSEPTLLELSEKSSWRRHAVQPATLAGVGTRNAIAEVPEVP